MKLFKQLGGGGGGKDPHSLVNKCVQVSSFNLLCEESVGSGGYASIYRVKDQATNQVYALKHLRLPPDSDAVADVRQEMKIMHLLGSHPNVLKLHAASFAGPAGKETDAFMVMDYCPTTLLDMMQRSNFQLDDFFVHEVFSEVCHAVAHMHMFSPPYAHRDIKAENVLKTAKGHWVLCDFGSATTRAQVYESPAEIAMEEDVIRRTTTPAYRAPEMWDLLSRKRIDTKVDIWALGVLLYVLVFGKLPFQGDSKLSVLFGKYDMPPGKPPPVCDLIRDMLTPEPSARPDILAVLSRLEVVKQHLAATVAGVPPPPPAALPATPHSAPHHRPATHSAHQPTTAQRAAHSASGVRPNGVAAGYVGGAHVAEPATATLIDVDVMPTAASGESLLDGSPRKASALPAPVRVAEVPAPAAHAVPAQAPAPGSPARSRPANQAAAAMAPAVVRAPVLPQAAPSGHSRRNSVVVEAVEQQQQQALELQGCTSAPAAASDGSSAALELSALKVQLKGVLVSHNALAARVKHLEDIVVEQAALIRSLHATAVGGAPPVLQSLAKLTKAQEQGAEVEEGDDAPPGWYKPRVQAPERG